MVLLLGLYMCILAVMAVGWIVSYVLRGIGMYTIGKNRGMANPWLAFIPYGRTYFQGELCGPVQLSRYQIKTPGLWMILIPIITNILSGVFYLLIWGGVVVEIIRQAGSWGLMNGSGSVQGHRTVDGAFSGMGIVLILFGVLFMTVILLIGSAANCTLQVLVNRTIYQNVTHPNHAVIHAVVGLFIPLYTSVYFFLIRNREAQARRQGAQTYSQEAQTRDPQE